jgi:hypothetical protein
MSHNPRLGKSMVHRTGAHQRSEPQDYDPTPACTYCWKSWADSLPTELGDPCPESVALAAFEKGRSEGFSEGYSDGIAYADASR